MCKFTSNMDISTSQKLPIPFNPGYYIEERCGYTMARRHVRLPGYGRGLFCDRVALSEFSSNDEF